MYVTKRGVVKLVKKREDLSLVAVKLDPRVLKQLHTVLCVHILREIELEVKLKIIIQPR